MNSIIFFFQKKWWLLTPNEHEIKKYLFEKWRLFYSKRWFTWKKLLLFSKKATFLNWVTRLISQLKNVKKNVISVVSKLLSSFVWASEKSFYPSTVQWNISNVQLLDQFCFKYTYLGMHQQIKSLTLYFLNT